MKQTADRLQSFNSNTEKLNLNKNVLFVIILSVILYSCSFGPYYSKSVKNWQAVPVPDSIKLEYSMYLIGDAGGPNLNHQEPVLKLLQQFLENDSNSTTVFLGDNIYFDGMPAPGEHDRGNAEKKINESLNILKNYKGEVYFIAGNHDWEYMRHNGLARINYQEAYIENYLNRGNTFIPDNGCPGPYMAAVHSDVILLAIDSQWWLHKYEKPYGRCGDCDAEDENDMLLQLEDFIKNNKNKHIVIVAHHPLMSNGNHGGYYNIVDYFFPLTLIHPKLYIPLPGIGSLYPLYRKFGGVDQDIAHYRYQDYINKVSSIIKNYDNVVYAAGHDHNIQYHEEEKVNHIISGSGSKVTPVKGGDEALFTQKHNGFAIIKYYNNGQAWVEFWIPESDGSKGKMAFRYQMYTRKTGAPESYCSLSAVDYSDSIITVKATDKYEVYGFHKFFFGNHYRKEWITPVTVPLMDLKTEAGGLIPYGIGGGKQSITLKLKNLDEREYVLRSINKDYSQKVPIDYRNNFIHDIIQDQISAQHPYAALTVPPLEDAVHVYHNNPKLVLIPNDSCLGPYREKFMNMLAFFEENPDGNHEDVKSLGYSKNIVGTDKMRAKLENDNDNVLDERNFLRARLLDMLIGDWDRHERQYRWAIFKTSKGELYKPVPEDRDQVYFKFDGLIPSIASRKWTIRNLQNFDYEYNDIIGLNASAVRLDRRYLSSLSEKDWKEIADSIKVELTNIIIDSAIHQLPDSIFKLHGQEIIDKLKCRRNKLTDAAISYYKTLSKYIDVFGSDKNEKFIIERINNKETKIKVFKINSEGEVKDKIYERIIYKDQTKEVRLYGLAGNDDFEIHGDVNKGIKVFIIGGDESDTLNDQSHVSGRRKKTRYYDNEQGNKILQHDETQLRLSSNENVNYPTEDKFFYDYLGPKFSFAYNEDDGFFIGAGAVTRKYKFRGDPYGSQHAILVAAATNTGSWRFGYNGDIRNFYRKLDLGINFKMYTPHVINFFGFGNNSRQTTSDISFFRSDFNQTVFNLAFKKDIKKYFTAGIGPQYQYYKLLRRANTLVEQTFTDPSFYDSKYYVGLRGYFKLGTRDNPLNPTRGILVTGEIDQNLRLDKTEAYTQILSDFTFYITPNLPFQLTFASRTGIGLNYGSYAFYQANALGDTYGIGQTGTLRGFRKTRFIGDKSFYQNTDVRVQLFKINGNVFTSKVGIHGFIDAGKVWVRNQESKTIHAGFGGGIWLDFYKLLIAGAYSFSGQENLITIRMGFLF